MARTKASRLSQAGRRGVDAGVGDTTRTARAGTAFPPPAQEPSEREPLARAPPTRSRPSLRRARTARATTTRGSRARPATRSRRWWHRERRDARRFATDPRTTFRACTLRPAFPRSLARRPRRNPESRRRQRRAPCASRDTSTVRPTSARARAPAPTRPLRHPFQRVAFLGRAEEATPLSESPAVPRNISHRRSNISRARSLALRFFLIPASRASLPGQVFASLKPSARCW